MNSDDELYEEDYSHCSEDGGDAYGMLGGNADEQKSYTVLKEDDIRNRQEDDITKISSLLFISRDAACILLSRHGWSPTRVEEEWFADEEGVRKADGLFDKPVVSFPGATKLVCEICFEDYPPAAIRAATCGHAFCVMCWTAYISTSINDGPGCLNLRCPAVPKCVAAIGADMIDMLASDQDKKKYRSYLLRSYIEDSRTRKWCPAPGCDCAIEFDISSGGNYDVSCQCSYSFCWNCTEEVHRPVDCDTVSSWILKNSSEAENTTWIIANTKPCPSCRRPIEKNKGCMAMRCRPPCNYSFCWICLSSSTDHTGCNRYRDDGSLKEEERQRKTIRNSLARYTHYYERWAANDSSRKKALLDLQKVKRVCVQKLSQAQDLPETELRFILEAWLQIAECRRVLKWSYAYGYYNLTEGEQGKKEFFEYLQRRGRSRVRKASPLCGNRVAKVPQRVCRGRFQQISDQAYGTD